MWIHQAIYLKVSDLFCIRTFNMARNKNRLEQRNQKLYSRYQELYSKKLNSKRLYTYDAILAMLANEFFLQEEYISKLILTMKSNHKSVV